MKPKFLLFALGAAALGVTSSCSDEFGIFGKSTDVVLTANVEGQTPNTRVGFATPSDGTAAFYWSANDEIGVTTVDGSTESTSLTKLTLASGAGTGSAQFKGDAEGEVTLGSYAIYPYDKSNQVSSTGITYNYPAEYTYTKVDNLIFDTKTSGNYNSTNAAMLATGMENGNATFKHLGGVFCVKIPEMPITSGKMSITATGKKINGQYTAAFTEGKTTQIDLAETTTASEQTVTINFSGATVNQPGVFYFPAPVGNGYELTLDLVDGSNQKYMHTVESGISLTRAYLYGMIIADGVVSSTPITVATTAAAAQEALGTDGATVAVDLTSDTSSDKEATITVPPVEKSSSATEEDKTSTTLVVNAVTEGSTIKIEDGAKSSDTSTGDSGSSTNKESSVEEMTISLPSTTTTTTTTDESGNEQKEEKTADVNVEITMPSTTVTLEANTGSTTVNKATVSTAENTFVIGSGVTVKDLIVAKGNIRIKKGGTFEKITNSTGGTIYVTVDEDADIPSCLTETDNIKIMSNKYEVQKLANAGANGGTYTLDKDVTLTGNLWINKALTLNLDGHTITVPTGKIFILNSASTVNMGTDGKIVGCGTQFFFVYPGAKAVVNGGSIINNSTTASHQTVFVGNNSTSLNTTLEINGTTISAPNCYGVCVLPNSGTTASLTVKGDTEINAKHFAISGNGSMGTCTINIEGGKFTSNNYAIYLPQPGTTTISGGTFTGNAGAVSIQRGTLNISGGEFISNGTTNATVPATGDGTAGLYNGTLAVIARYGNVVADITGGTFTAKGTASTITATHNAVETSYTKTISVKDATFNDLSLLTAASESTYKVSGSFTLTDNAKVSDLNISGDKAVEVNLNNKTVTVNQTATSEINLKSADNYVTFKDGTISVSGSSDTDSSLKVTQGVLTLNNVTYTASGWCTALLRQLESNIVTTNSTVTGKTNSILTAAN